MASCGFSCNLTAAASACLPLRKPGTTPFKTKHVRRRSSCKIRAGNAGAGDDDALVRRNIDRRDVLLALTGFAATTNNLGLAALAADDTVPAVCLTPPITNEVIKCVSADGFQCPGPFRPEDVVDFTALPPPNGPLRVRRPAHLVAADKEYVKKYEAGIRMMKDLDGTDDARSFKRQAAIHEAYCNFHYKVTAAATAAAGAGSPATEIDFDVHFSSIFAPWHRMYIYFFERIIGELVGDSTFALPYWNWDAPDGMILPAIFNNESSPLYDAKRNREHVDAVIDLNLGPGKQNDLPVCSDDACLKATNLCNIYRQMAVDTAAQFHGDKFCAARVMSPGSLENAAHTAVHIWLGDPLAANKGEDMGVLGTAGRDPVFYSHHANVDRLWHLWTTALGNENFVGASAAQWLDTGFVFYDEKRRPVRIRIRDVLDAGRLGYAYEEKETLEWQDKRPTPAAGIERSGAKPSVPPAATSFPVALKNGEKKYVTVERPEKARAGGGSSKKAPEVLVVDVTIDPCEYAKFDVLVNVPKGQEARVGPQNSEFAGSFVNLPHGGGDGGGRGSMGSLKLAYRFALRELVEDLGCGRDRLLDVTLIPVAGEKVVVDDVRVELLE
jgi:polyphenol oxidase